MPETIDVLARMQREIIDCRQRAARADESEAQRLFALADEMERAAR
jgi:hypothetical protein